MEGSYVAELDHVNNLMEVVTRPEGAGKGKKGLAPGAGGPGADVLRAVISALRLAGVDWRTIVTRLPEIARTVADDRAAGKGVLQTIADVVSSLTAASPAPPG